MDVDGGSPKGLSEVLAELIRVVNSFTTGGNIDHSQFTYTIPLPASMALNSSWKHQMFNTHSMHHLST
jgi:hypothetical protein